MNDKAYIRLVDSHSECICRHHDLPLSVYKILLIFLPFFRIMEKNELELEQKELEESKGTL